jgi:hypothetical protein
LRTTGPRPALGASKIINIEHEGTGGGPEYGATITYSREELAIASGAAESGTATSYQIADGQPPAVTITAAPSPTGLTAATCAVDR